MRLTKKLSYHNHDFNAITDDNRCVDSQTLFVKTAQNAKYCDNIQSPFIEAKDLSEVFALPKHIVGITGTNGKTTTAACIYSILLDLGYKVALLGTRGFFINGEEIKPKGLTTPPVLELYENFERAQECDYFIMEVSSHAIAQERIAGVNFALKILTNITSDHLDFHGNVEEYVRVKNSFFTDDKPKLINADEKHATYNQQNAISYGIESPANMNVRAYSLKYGICAHIAWSKNTPTTPQPIQPQESTMHSNLYGKYNLYNLLCAVSACKILTNATLNEICEKLKNFGGVSGRMEIISQNPLIIVDFAHTHDGMKQIFEAFMHHKIVVLFGAGGDRDMSKRAKMGAVAQQYAQRIYLTSDNPRNENPDSIIAMILDGISERGKTIVESNRQKAIDLALRDLASDEVLLVLGKGDETYQIIGEKKIPFDDREIIREILKRTSQISQQG